MIETGLREEICRLGSPLSGKMGLTGLGTIAVLVLYMVLVGGLAVAAGAPPADSKNVVTFRGEDALRLLVGNTLRSVGHKKSFPTYRYFMNEHLEYHCSGWDPSNVRRSEIMIHRKTVGCDIRMPSVRDGRLCESYKMTCEDNEIALWFVKRSATPDPGAGQILGRVTVLKMRYSTASGEHDLIKGNATIFPDFDPTPKRSILQSEAPVVKIEMDSPATCNDGVSDVIRLENPDAVKSAISGNTLVPFKGSLDESPGSIDDRAGQYFDPRGTIIDIRIPTAPAGAQAQSLSPTPSDSGTGVHLYRWKIKDGKLCRTEGEDPSEFFCGDIAVYLQKASASWPNPRFCASYSGGVFLIAKGNPFAVDFSRATGK